MKFRKIEIGELPKKIPNYKKIRVSKDIAVYQWLKNWIIEGLKNNTVRINELLPSKSDLAYHLGVSAGTVQNAIRYLEDEGYFESKQRIGTLIKDNLASNNKFKKLTSKREKTIYELKKMIIGRNYQIGDLLPSGKELKTYLGSSVNTMRLALEHLEKNGFITTDCTKGTEAKRFLTKIPSVDIMTDGHTHTIKKETLVDKIEIELRDYIIKNYKIGQKLSTHSQLAQMFNVSIKTVHDALKMLICEGYLSVHRGRYGTIITELPNNISACNKKDSSTLTFKEDASSFYYYQKVENYIKNLIRENYNINDKLPPMELLAKDFNVSTNTIKKALQNISNQGYVRFERGRYGGTFITDIPETTNENAFKWIAVSPDYVKVNKN